MERKVGNYDVLDSGSITSVSGQDILFDLADNIRIRFAFTMTEDRKQSTTYDLQNGEMIITFQNFNNPLGTEFTDAVEIGTYKGRKLLLHVRILGMKNTSNRVVIYTWYLGDNISNG